MSDLKEILPRIKGRVASPAEKAEALRRITLARFHLIQDAPFFGVLAARLELVERADIGTMATDGVKLFYNALFVLEVTEAELKGIWVHEVLHCALQHMNRLQNRPMKEANEAADLAINPEIIRLKFALPQGVWLDWKYDGMGFEEIFAARQQAKRKEAENKAKQDKASKAASEAAQGKQGEPGKAEPGKPDNGAGEASKGEPGKGEAGQGEVGQEPGNGSGAGEPGTGQASQGTGEAAQGEAGNGQASAQGEASNGAGEAAQAATGQGETDAAETYDIGGILKPGNGTKAEIEKVSEDWQIWTRQAIAVTKKAGDLPGFFKRLIGEINASGEDDLREPLAEFINSKTSVDYSFNRPNRQYISSGFYLPGTVADGLEHLVFAIDTSGSIDAHMTRRAAEKVIDAMESGKVEKCTIVFADTHVRNVQEFEKGDDIAAAFDARGGGGTRFDKTFEWIEANAPDATAVIYLTDMECHHWGTDPGLPVLWAIHGDSRKFDKLAARAPFGECVYVGRLE